MLHPGLGQILDQFNISMHWLETLNKRIRNSAQAINKVQPYSRQEQAGTNNRRINSMHVHYGISAVSPTMSANSQCRTWPQYNISMWLTLKLIYARPVI
eukprot:scaffold227380_cov36-Prasinocladus_malaysianus.AAC.2